jgi:hypothetical protein
MKRIIFVAAGVVFLAFLGLTFLGQPSDQQLIKEALEDAVKASRDGRPGGVLDNLSGSLQYNGDDVLDRGAIADYVKRAKPDITIVSPTPVIRGDRAIISSAVDVTMRVGPASVPMHIDQVEITLARESGVRFGLLPTKVWRIRSVTAKSVPASSLGY